MAKNVSLANVCPPLFPLGLNITFGSITTQFQSFFFPDPLSYLRVQNTTNQTIMINFGQVQPSGAWLYVPANTVFDHSATANRIIFPQVVWCAAYLVAPTSGSVFIAGY